MTDDRNLTSFHEHYIEFLRQSVGELEHRVHELEEELDRMNKDQLSLIFLCSVATVLCMTLSVVMLVLS